MAEPATQSPYISSSGGGSSSGAGEREGKGAGPPQSGSDSFVSSSQPVSLFSTLQARAQDTYLTHSGNQREASEMSAVPNAGDEFASGRNQDRVCGTGGSLSIKAASIVSPGFEDYSAGSRVHTSAPMRNAGPLGNDDLKAEVSVNGKAGLGGKDPLKELASSVESKFALLTHPPTPPGSKMGFPHSSGEEKDSPESPFEVIADKLELEKEFQDVLASNGSPIGSNWVKHGEREVLTDIPEDGICEFRAKPRSGGRIPSVPGLTRQSSGTNAALEEISKCVREMHSFTSELLNWDLIPKDTEDEAGALVNSRCSASPSQETNTDHAGVKAGKREAEKTPGPPQPVTVSLHPKNKLKNPIVSQEAGVVKIASAPGEPKSAVGWPNPGFPDATDADSSGESDDTVIEDPVADLMSQNTKTPEKTGAPVEPFGSVKTEIVQARDEALKKMVGPHPEDQVPSKNLGPADDFVDKSVPDSPTEAGWDLGAGGQDSVEEHASHEGFRLSSTRVCPSPPSDGVKQVGRPDVAKAERSADSAKECLKKPEENDSPEDPVETFSEAELRAARSQGVAPSQDFEQERLTIKALKEVGRKTGMERQPPGPRQVPLPSGRPSMQYYSVPIDVPAPAPKSALEKRPLCLKEAVGVKLTPGPAAYGVHGGGVPHASSRELSPQPPLPHTVKNLLAGFSVRDLIFWRDVKKSAAVFSTTLVLLLSLAAFSVISVVSYLILALLSVTISFRVYKSVIQAVQKSEDGHPFKTYLDLDITLSSEAFHNYVSSAMVYVNRALKLVMRLFLVEDLVDSLKLAVVMWLMTYVGAIFNGITLLILGELLVFSVPVVYEKYKVQIDHYVGIAREQFNSIMAKIQAKVPGAVKKKPE